MAGGSSLKKGYITLILGFLLFALPSWGGDFEKGQEASRGGNYKAAHDWFTIAAEKGDVRAQSVLGFSYMTGSPGVPQNTKTAAKWYALAAKQGDADSQLFLGMLFAEGDGVSQDLKAAAKLYTAAAEQGVALAQHQLGILYYKGRGVLQDYTYAYMWANIAALNDGMQISEDLRDVVSARMTPSQLEKAQDLSRECKAKNFTGC